MTAAHTRRGNVDTEAHRAMPRAREGRAGSCVDKPRGADHRQPMPRSWGQRELPLTASEGTSLPPSSSQTSVLQAVRRRTSGVLSPSAWGPVLWRPRETAAWVKNRMQARVAGGPGFGSQSWSAAAAEQQRRSPAPRPGGLHAFPMGSAPGVTQLLPPLGAHSRLRSPLAPGHCLCIPAGALYFFLFQPLH